MQRKIGWCLVLCAALLLSVRPVLADTINGSIGFSGTFTQNGGTLGNLATATSMTIKNVSVISSTGDLAGAGAPLSFASPIGVNGNSPSLVGAQLWSVTVGGQTFTFDVSTETQVFTSASQINLQGTGVMHGPGFDPTSGFWQLGFGRSGQSFTWQSTAATTPEPGTLALLAAGLVGLVGRRLRK